MGKREQEKDPSEDVMWAAGKDYYKLLLNIMGQSAQCQIAGQIKPWCRYLIVINSLVIPFIRTNTFNHQLRTIKDSLNVVVDKTSMNLDCREAQIRDYLKKKYEAEKKLEDIQLKMYGEMRGILLPILGKSDDSMNPYGSGD